MEIEKIESYPSLTIDEQETVLTWDAKERAWHICTDYPAHARKYEAASKTVRKYGLSERYWLAHGMYNLIKSDPYRKLVEQKKAELKSLINHGATDAAIGAELGMTVSRVKYWIKEWNLGRRKHIIATGRFR